MLISRRAKLILFAVVLVGMTTLFVVRYTDACRLEEVSLDDSSVENWPDRFGFDGSRSVVRQPLDSVAEHLLGRRNVFKVDIDYSLPNGIEVWTNNFEPACFVVDRVSERMFGLNDAGRLISLENCRIDWDNPVLTSVEVGRLYGLCGDVRVKVVVEQLRELREDDIDLYRLIDEIDFGNRGFLRVTIAGLPYRLKARAEKFHTDMDRFVEFVSRFAPDLEEVKGIDLRFDGMIICAGGKI